MYLCKSFATKSILAIHSEKIAHKRGILRIILLYYIVHVYQVNQFGIKHVQAFINCIVHGCVKCSFGVI